ncbi:unnamed protein product [Caenorhabditis angaria]|uniref:Neurotransmitter-gated ion-channel ligand-binding domain-containing protein n=1 Tax=Caenorhabditis angaria TaxID=860376 RepID=A0A9P1J0F2_9PELO|nr:unnamed protein product [Caenorhabditis angaria]
MIFLFLFLSYCTLLLADSQIIMNQNVTNGYSGMLTKFLMEKHEKCSPPDGLVHITHNIELVQIISLNELNQNMQVVVYITQKWIDKTLTWVPEEYGNIRTTWLPDNSIWIPDIIVFNTLEHKALLSAVRSPIKVSSLGEVTFAFPAIYTVLCPIGIANFPFDDQVCKIRFASWAYSEDKIMLNASHKPLLRNYSPNEEWALKDVDMARKEYEHEETIVSEIIYYIKVSRKPFYYLISLVVPSYIICVLSIAGLFARFSTRHERQEKFTLGVTAILSMAVLSLVVTEKVPHSSESVPLLIVYIHFIIIMVTIATILTSTVMRVHAKGFRNVLYGPPEWMRKVLLIRKAEAVFVEVDGKWKIDIHTTAEQWGEVSRRMDYLLSAIFIFIISTPTVYLFYLCFKLDHALGERLLLESAKKRDLYYY